MNIGNPLPASFQRLFFRMWRPAVLVLGLGLIVYLLFFRHLGTLLPGYAQPELAAYQHSADWHSIATNPINAPYTILVWLLTAVFHHHLLMTRVVAACFGILAVLAFYAIVRSWYSFRVATLGTLLFASAGGWLHWARLGSPQVLQASILALLAFAIWYKKSHHRTILDYVILGVCALLLYVPGMLWFELLGAALVWRSLWGQLKRTPQIHLIGGWTAFLVILTPLAIASIRNPQLLLNVAGLPTHWGSITDMASNFWHTVTAIGIQGLGDPTTWLGRMPLLGATERILVALGLYAYVYRERSLRALFIASAMAVSVLVISLGGGLGFAALIPLLYLCVIHGLDHFLGRWFVVFPRNPFARFSGVAIVCIMLFFSVLYQVRSYFVAWPHTTVTRQTFSLPPS